MSTVTTVEKLIVTVEVEGRTFRAEVDGAKVEIAERVGGSWQYAGNGTAAVRSAGFVIENAAANFGSESTTSAVYAALDAAIQASDRVWGWRTDAASGVVVAKTEAGAKRALQAMGEWPRTKKGEAAALAAGAHLMLVWADGSTASRLRG